MVMCRTPECAKAPVPTCSGRIWERLSRSRRTEGVNTWSTRVSLEVHSMRSSADRSTCCSWPATTKTTFAEPYADGRVFGTDKLTGHREGAIMNSWPATPSDGVPEEIDGVNVLQRSGLFESGTPVEPDLDRQFTKVVGFWAPRRWLTPETMDVDGMVGGDRGNHPHKGPRRLRRPGHQQSAPRRAVGGMLRAEQHRHPTGHSRATPLGIRTTRLLRRRAVIPDGRRRGALHLFQHLDRDRRSIPHPRGVDRRGRPRVQGTLLLHPPMPLRPRRVHHPSPSGVHVLRRYSRGPPGTVLTAFQQTIAPEEWSELFGAEGSRHHEPLNLAIIDVQDIESAAPFV